MSRQIMFRAWDDFQQRYVFEGFHVIGEITCFGGMERVIHDTAKERSAARGYETSIEAWNDFTFEEFTGLKDRDGKLIYEGDIVSFTIPGITHGPEREDYTNALVWYDEEDAVWTFGKWRESSYDGLCGFTIPGDRIDTESFKVLGNVHENGDFLK